MITNEEWCCWSRWQTKSNNNREVQLTCWARVTGSWPSGVRISSVGAGILYAHPGHWALVARITVAATGGALWGIGTGQALGRGAGGAAWTRRSRNTKQNLREKGACFSFLCAHNKAPPNPLCLFTYNYDAAVAFWLIYYFIYLFTWGCAWTVSWVHLYKTVYVCWYVRSV